MPEGDTVWRTARTLDRALTGQVLDRTDFRVPEHATLDLAGRVVTGTVSRGKHLLTRIGEDHTLHTHLRMEGSWHIYRPGSRWRRPAAQARVVLSTPGWVAVGFSLGVVEVVARADEHRVVGHLGPDLLSPDWDEEEALRRLTTDPARPIAEALLDQRVLAGIGTVYRAETLFVTGLHPLTPAGDVLDPVRVVRAARRMLVANRERTLQVTTGVARPGEQHWVYGRAGAPCRRCRTPIETAELGPPGRARLVFWCPSCQPAR